MFLASGNPWLGLFRSIPSCVCTVRKLCIHNINSVLFCILILYFELDSIYFKDIKLTVIQLIYSNRLCDYNFVI